MIGSIQTNSSAGRVLQSIQVLDRSSASLSRMMASGTRIQSAADDSAGLALAVGMDSRVSGLAVASRNALDAIGALQTADSALGDLSTLLQRMRELAVQAATGTLTSSDRAALQQEFQALRSQMGSVVNQAKWNGAPLLDGNYATHIQVGVDAGVVQRVAIPAMGDSVIAPIGGSLSFSGTGTLRTTPVFTQNYTTLVEIDTRGFPSGGTITATIQLGNGSSAASYDLYRNAVTYGGAQNRPINSLANAYDVAPGTTTTLTYNFTASSSDRYLLGFEGNWFSAPTATNTFSYDIVVTGASQSINVSSVGNATNSMSALDGALATVNAARASVGAQIGGIGARLNSLGLEAISASQSLSTANDLDYASASAELARQLVLKQATSSILSRIHDSQRMSVALLEDLKL